MNLKKMFVAVFCALFLFQSSIAASLPYSDKVGAFVASLIAGKTSERVTGVALNSLAPASMSAAIANQVTDPTYQKTISAASFVATGVLTAAIAAGTAPAWVVFALGTAAAVAVPLAIDGLVKWLVDSSGNVVVSGGSSVSTDSMTLGGPYFSSDNGVAGATALAAAQGDMMAYHPNPDLYLKLAYVVDNGTSFYIMNKCTPVCSADNQVGALTVFSHASGAPATCAAGNVSVNSGSCVALPSLTSGAAAPVSSAAAIAALPSSELSKPANPQLLADLANKLWQQSAATPGTIPYDESRPILVSDVQAVQASNTAAYPAVGDLVATGVNPATGGVSMPIPGAVGGSQTGVVTGTQTSTTTNTATGTTTVTNTTSMLDWGTFIAPDLQAPSIESILDPLFNMWPAWKDFSFPAHTSACPQPSFTLPASVIGGRTISFDSMCIWVEQIRSAMQAVFTVAWSLVIIFVVMGA